MIARVVRRYEEKGSPALRKEDWVPSFSSSILYCGMEDEKETLQTGGIERMWVLEELVYVQIDHFLLDTGPEGATQSKLPIFILEKCLETKHLASLNILVMVPKN